VVIQAVATQPTPAASLPSPATEQANTIVLPLPPPVHAAALDSAKPGNPAPVRAAAAPTAKPLAARRRTPASETPTAAAKAASPPGPTKPSSINLGLTPPARAD
jgi:hypothetical protein